MNSLGEKTIDVFGVPIHAVDQKAAEERISSWVAEGSSRYVCICNVHSVVLAVDNDHHGSVIRRSDLNTADGAPIAWVMRRRGQPTQPRVNGPDLMWSYFRRAEANRETIFLYGSTEVTLQQLIERISENFPMLKIAGAYSPPFRALTETEERGIIKLINDSGAGTVWVSLGCPKQESWMGRHRGKVSAVMIGVGAAFDYHAGTLRRAPPIMRNYGLEWFYRLLQEPIRLFPRYYKTNKRFVVLLMKEAKMAVKKGL